MEHDLTPEDPTRSVLSRRRMLAAGGIGALAATLSGCGLTSDDGDGGGGEASAAPTSGSDGGTLARILKDKRVRFGVDLSFEPLEYRDPKTKEPTGYAIEVSRLLAEALGAEPEWVEVPFQEIVSAQAAGRFDMAGIQAVNTPARAQQVAFATAPVFLEGTYLLQRKGLSLSSAEQLNSSDVTVAILAGSAQATTAKLLFPKAKRKELNDDVSATSDVVTGRSDALFIGDYGISDALEKGLTLISNRPVATAWNTYFMPQGDVTLNQFVTTFLQNKASDGTLEQLWNRFVARTIEASGVQSAPVRDPYLAAAYA